ncbi:unnamed protein product [Microthlaspi erraticum]|uniref:Arabidopsis retrotransposon Orf1 C-terminal domain-containing protein n=1 Tax=Microthlaspi erraticum TaxID=1685480 RepID=A0A6D2JYW0_9BRAS|nr:unnamed protein product [Microthlaspi erraticum]
MKREDELPMFQEHYNALLSMEFVETKYPHDKTMKALGIFNDVDLVLKNMHLGRSKAAQIRSPVLEYVHKALANTFFARKTWTINEGESSSLTWESSPSSHAQGWKRIRGDSTQGISCLP